MEYMEETYEDEWIGIAVHNSDPMEKRRLRYMEWAVK